MAKACMRPYYALGLLVAGIVLLYLFIQNVESFANENKMQIFLKVDTDNNVTYVSSNDSNISGPKTPSPYGNIDINVNNKLEINDYNIYYYTSGSNCSKGEQMCWRKVTSNITDTGVKFKTNDNKSIASKSDKNILNVCGDSKKSINCKMENNKIKITGLTKANLGNAVYNNQPNVRIDINQ
jgi:hypothetical protein